MLLEKTLAFVKALLSKFVFEYSLVKLMLIGSLPQ